MGEPASGVAWSRRLPLSSVRGAFAAFYRQHCVDELRALIWTPADEASNHAGVRCDCALLLAHAPALCTVLLDEPLLVLPLADDGLRDAQQTLLGSGCPPPPLAWGVPPGGWASSPTTKPLVHARLDATRLACARAPWLRVCRLRECHVNRLVAVSGCVARQGASRVREAARGLTCTQCRFVFAVPLDAETGAMTTPPASCPNPGGCSGCSFKAAATPPGLAVDPALCVDATEIVLALHPGGRDEQHGSDAANLGVVGAAVSVALEADLVHACPVGRDVTITGIVRRRWSGPALLGGRSGADMVLYAVCVTAAGMGGQHGGSSSAMAPVSRGIRSAPGDDLLHVFTTAFWSRHAHHPLMGRDLLVVSLCPQLRGLRAAKLAVLLALCGGSPCAGRQQPGPAGAAEQQRSIRGEIHELLLGDPGCGKSQLLRCAVALARPRGVLANGGHVTLAGLTAAVVREPGSGGGSSLEAGALLRAHGGVLALDEVDQLTTAARGALHEALEQRTLSFAKAGAQMRLPCCATLLAACNARPGALGGVRCTDLEAATSLAPPLLSRFDVIVRIPDILGHGPEAQARDRAHATAVLAMRRAVMTGAQAHTAALAAAQASSQEGDVSPDDDDATVAAFLSRDNTVWPGHLLSRYIAAVRTMLAPRLSPQAERLCSAFYCAARTGSSHGGGPGRATPRLLEAALRLTRAHARLMGHAVADEMDACQALLLLRASNSPGDAEESDNEGGDGTADSAAREHAALCAELDAALGCGWRSAPVSGQENEVQQQPPPPLALPAPEMAAFVEHTGDAGGGDDWGF